MKGWMLSGMVYVPAYLAGRTGSAYVDQEHAFFWGWVLGVTAYAIRLSIEKYAAR